MPGASGSFRKGNTLDDLVGQSPPDAGPPPQGYNAETEI
jgi:hypothetical protein